MDHLTCNPAFCALSIVEIILCALLMMLWGYSGGVRVGTKTTLNPEDIKTTSPSASVIEADPPEVARVIRVFNNLLANMVPFTVLGFLYVAHGAPALTAQIVFGIFAGARIAHTIAYLGKLQPWRTIFFAIGGLDTLVLLGLLIYQMVGCHCACPHHHE